MNKGMVVVSALLVLCTGAALAQGIEKGRTEVGFTLGYYDAEIDDMSLSATMVSGSGGYALTDHLELGGLVGYVKLKVDFDVLGEGSGSSTISATMFGPWVQWNFLPKEKWTPFVGASYQLLNGKAKAPGADSGDLLKNRWELLGGVKVYPFPNVGLNFAVSYGQMKFDEGNLKIFTDDRDIKLWSFNSGVTFVF